MHLRIRWPVWPSQRTDLGVGRGGLPGGEGAEGGAEAGHAPRPAFPEGLLYELAL